MEVYVLVGVPGSGKSSYAKKLEQKQGREDNVITLSSDDYRIKMFGSLEKGNEGRNSTKVFEKMHLDLNKLLKEKSHELIIYDATNLSRKRRRALYTNIKQWSKEEAYVSIVYFQSTLERLLETNRFRKSFDANKHVPDSVIRKMYEQLQVPRLKVDCDSLIYSHTDLFRDDYLQFIKEYPVNRREYSFPSGICDSSRDVMGDELRGVFLGHDCAPYHLETIDQHIDMCVNNAYTLYPLDNEILDMAKFHDLGKSVTKKMVFKDGGAKATYMNHANVSANYYLSYLASIGCLNEQSLDVVEAIHQHMNAHQGLGEKNIRNNRLTNRVIDLTTRFAKIDSMSKITGEGL